MQTVSTFLEELSAKTPTPGGGSVAAFSAATAASLGMMVVNYSLGKKNLLEHQDLLKESHNTLKNIHLLAMECMPADMVAYEVLNILQKLAEDDPERIKGWTSAVNQAIKIPRTIARCGIHTLHCCEQLVGHSNQWLQSDLAIAAVMAEAAVASAVWNMRINAPLLADHVDQQDLAEEIDKTSSEARELRQHIEHACS